MLNVSVDGIHHFHHMLEFCISGSVAVCLNAEKKMKALQPSLSLRYNLQYTACLESHRTSLYRCFEK